MKEISMKLKDVTHQQIKSAVSEALFEAGLKSDMVSMAKAYKLLTRHWITKGIEEGKIRITPKKIGKQMIPLYDIVAYRQELLDDGKIELKK
jgi:hypothetical protein